MERLPGPLPAALVAMMVAACGGGGVGEDPGSALRVQAAARERELLMLADPAPCAAENQCGVLFVRSPVASCGSGYYVPYSLLSSTASAAEEAARQQSALALQAITASAAPPPPCPLIVILPPRAVCNAGECKLPTASTPAPAPAPAPNASP